jgi:hypothetical protein
MSLNLPSSISSFIDYDTYHIDTKKGKCFYVNLNKVGMSPSEFIESTNIKCTQYNWIKYDTKTNQYIKCIKTNKSAMLFIREEWVNTNILLEQEPAVVVEVVKQSSPQIPITKFYSPTNVVDVTNHETVIEVVSVVEPPLVEVPSGFSEKMIPEPITFYDGEEIREGLFFNAHDLQKFNPEFFHGLENSRNIREIVKLKNIPDLDVAYGSMIKNKGWCIRSNDGTKAKLFLSKEWVDTYFWKRTAEQITVMTTHDYAPPKVTITTDMTFIDCDGNTMDIDVYANLNEDGGLIEDETYFTVASISEGFELPSLHKTLINDNGRYEEVIHYKYMFCGGGDFQNLENAGCTGNENNNKQVKTMFLTFNGLMNVMYSKSSRNPNVRLFQKWADTTLFTTKFGSKKDKTKLVAKLLGVDVDELLNTITANASPVSCIYAFRIGTVGELRKRYGLSDNIPDNHLVVKYGYTDDLSKRTTTHMGTYGRNIRLLVKQYIDTNFVRDAENSLKIQLHYRILKGIKKTTMFDENNVEHCCKGEIELFTIEDTESSLKHIKKVYHEVGNKYSGRIAELKHKLEGELNVATKEIECTKISMNILEQSSTDLRATNKQLMLITDDYRTMLHAKL